jgi:putative spermidine/putrescine transport system permease protein
MLKRFWPWFWFLVGAAYFLVPLYATFDSRCAPAAAS